MADKTTSNLVPIPFVAGEMPSADKLTAITAQLRAGVAAMETLLGDPHNKGYAYSTATTEQLSPKWGIGIDNSDFTNTATKRLDIANIARLIGPASNLSPKTQSLSTTITETITAGNTFHKLKYPRKAGTTPTLTGVGAGIVNWNIFGYQTDEEALTGGGSFAVTEPGIVHGIPPLSIDCYITYETDPSQYAGGSAYQDANFNVIPSPAQTNAGGPHITWTYSAVTGKYTGTLPLIKNQQSNRAVDDDVLSDEDFNYDLTYTLPTIIKDYYASGNLLPEGFLYLYNHTTNTILEGAVIEYSAPNEIVVSEVDLSAAVAATEIVYLITVGTDITTSIDDLRNKWSMHSHDGTFGETAISANSIVGWNEEGGNFLPSSIDDNVAPQYMMRTGYDAAETQDYNDRNMMIGDLGMGSSTAARGSKYVAGDDTYSVFFGTTDFSIRGNATGIYSNVLRNVGFPDNRWEMNHPIYITDDSSSSVAWAPIPNTSVFAEESGGGNIGTGYGSFYSKSALFGPITNMSGPIVPLFEIDTDGVSSSGTGVTYETDASPIGSDRGWKTPKYQVIHYARRLTSTDAGVTITTGNTIQGAGTTVNDYTEVLIQLPDHLRDQTDWGFTSNDDDVFHSIMGTSVLLRTGGADSSNRWHAAGWDAEALFNSGGATTHGHVAAYSEVISYSFDENGIRIRFAEAGDFQTSATYWQTTGTPSLQVKITLWVLAPGTNLH